MKIDHGGGSGGSCPCAVRNKVVCSIVYTLFRLQNTAACLNMALPRPSTMEEQLQATGLSKNQEAIVKVLKPVSAMLKYVPNHWLQLALDPNEHIRSFATPSSVLIKVGSPATSFFVNGKLICSRSEYFKVALSARWSEGKKRALALPEDDPEAFNVYLNWLFGGCICTGQEDGSDNTWEEWDMVFKAYALGDKFLDTDFKDAVTDAVTAMLGRVDLEGFTPSPSPRDIELLYRITSATAKIRSLIAYDIASCTILDEEFLKTLPAYPKDFLAELFIQQRQIVTQNKEPSTQAAAALCEFHEHATGAEHCYRNKQL